MAPSSARSRKRRCALCAHPGVLRVVFYKGSRIRLWPAPGSSSGPRRAGTEPNKDTYAMPRKGYTQRKELRPDPKFNSILLARFVNALMKGGKKSTAEQIMYDAIDIIQEKTGQEGVVIVKQAVSNLKPVLEVKSRRVGGATYQVPIEVRPERRMALALRWAIIYARSRPGRTMAQKLAEELMAAAKNEGGAAKKREDTHRMAEANKAFAHYRW